jgi:hypothetical protein
MCIHVCILCDTKQHKRNTGNVVALYQAIIVGTDESGGSVNREAINLLHVQVSDSCVHATSPGVDGAYTEKTDPRVNTR